MGFQEIEERKIKPSILPLYPHFSAISLWIDCKSGPVREGIFPSLILTFFFLFFCFFSSRASKKGTGAILPSLIFQIFPTNPLIQAVWILR